MSGVVSGAYYNEIDPFAAKWLRKLIEGGHIAPGFVDERSIKDVHADDLRGFTQCHFFAGIRVWSYALRVSGWDDASPVWTGSCPCQPFSVAGQNKGKEDERHLWPEWYRLIRECRPPVVFGEQVAAAIGHGWLDLVQSDLEREVYAVGKAVLGACSVGAPHIRQRLYFVAESEQYRLHRAGEDAPQSGSNRTDSGLPLRSGSGLWEPHGNVADPNTERCREERYTGTRAWAGGEITSSELGVTNCEPERRLDREEGVAPQAIEGEMGIKVRQRNGPVNDRTVPNTVGMADSDGGRREQCDERQWSVPEPDKNSSFGVGQPDTKHAKWRTEYAPHCESHGRYGSGGSSYSGHLLGNTEYKGLEERIDNRGVREGTLGAPTRESIIGADAIGVVLDDTKLTRLEGLIGNGDHIHQPRWNHAHPSGSASPSGATHVPGPTNGFWADAEWLYCRDEKYRPTQPGLFPLAYGTPNRVGRLRGYGNAICAEVAIAFIQAYQSCN